jgi:hypothetical protein
VIGQALSLPRVTNSQPGVKNKNPIYAERKIQTIYLRDLSLETETVPYDLRQDYLIEKYNYPEMLHNFICGNEEGQILVNLDER